MLAEGLVMTDMHTAETAAACRATSLAGGFWDFEAEVEEGSAKELAHRRAMESRERHPFWAPDKVGEVTMKGAAEKCEVRRRRAEWARLLKRRYSPQAIAWCDTAVGMEKAVSVSVFFPPDDVVATGSIEKDFVGTDEYASSRASDECIQERRVCTPSDQAPNVPPLIVVSFRGSKRAADYFVTDLSPRFIPLSLPKSRCAVPFGGPDGDKLTRVDQVNGVDVMTTPDGAHGGHAPEVFADESEARLLPMLAHSKRPCATLGLWRAYAGAPSRAHLASDANTPRRVVRRAIREQLCRNPNALVVVTGHSLGGALAQLCAYDLLQSCPAVARRGAGAVTLVSFAAPRLFNRAFRQSMDAFEDSNRLAALRVVVASDIIPRLPPALLGGHHGVSSRLAIIPRARGKTRLVLDVDDHFDRRMWRVRPADAHCCHGIYLASQCTRRRRHYVPNWVDWPLTKMSKVDSRTKMAARSAIAMDADMGEWVWAQGKGVSGTTTSGEDMSAAQGENGGLNECGRGAGDADGEQQV